MTVTEKILARAAGKKEVQPGEIVDARVDLVYTMDFLGQVLFNHLEKIGADGVFDPEKVVVIFDHLTPAINEKTAQIQKTVREFAHKYGVYLYDVGRHGIMHQMIVEKGFARPGHLILGTDSHTPTAGAVGAVVAGVGATDAAVAMATGKSWLRVPEQVKVEVTGEFSSGVSARDLVFSLIKEKGWDGSKGEWAYKSIEFAGEAIEKMSLDQRLTATNLIADMGAKNAIISPDETTLSALGIEDELGLRSDEGAQYSEVMTVDVTDLPPLVACPHAPDNVHPVSEVEGTKIDQAVIASCSNARIEDLRIAAEVLAGNKVSEKTRLLISPATQSIFRRAVEEGLIETFIDAGALVGQPTCGPCFGGQMGLLAPGETCITSTPRNMKGRMGSKEASIFSANPAVVAASAVKGEIADPREFLKGGS